jgi:hypothetical protein
LKYFDWFFLVGVTNFGQAEQQAGRFTLLVEVGHLFMGVVDIIEGIVQNVHLVLGELLRVAVLGAMAISPLLVAIFGNDRHHFLNYYAANAG